MKYFIIGGAGFIGSHMATKLIENGEQVMVFDNLSSGSESRIAHLISNTNFYFVKGDLMNKDELTNAMKGYDFVMHFASNPDISKAVEFPRIDLEQGTIATFNVLDAMRANKVSRIVFPSGSGVYGDVGEIYTKEDFGPLLPTSMYGASKLSAEGLISAFCHMYDIQAWIFRFANVVGIRQTHGVVFDFINKLKKNPNELLILGDGNQSKSYVHISEVIDSILFCIEKSNSKINLFNVASTDFIDVNNIADIVINGLGLRDVRFKYTGGRGGWKGDVPVVRLDVSKINKLGWKSKLTSEQAITRAVEELCR